MVSIAEREDIAPLRAALFVPAHRDNLIPKAVAVRPWVELRGDLPTVEDTATRADRRGAVRVHSPTPYRFSLR